jgi:NifU-like protein involved in Fe-S cluster formation
MLSSVAAEHVQRPRNAGPLTGATHTGLSGSPGEGPHVKIWLVIERGKILRASYDTHGCPSSIAAASMLAQILIGRDVEKAKFLTEGDLLLILGGLPEGKERFAGMAIEALRMALE